MKASEEKKLSSLIQRISLFYGHCPKQHILGAQDPKEIDARLICPVFDVMFPFLPEKIRKPLRFGVVHKGVSFSVLGVSLFCWLYTFARNVATKLIKLGCKICIPVPVTGT